MEYAAYLIKFWPLASVSLILMVAGQFFSLRVFTKENAYAPYSKDAAGKLARFFFWWGRESLPLHPIAVGWFIGKCWTDPMKLGWGVGSSVCAFMGCGAVSLFLWVILKGKAKEYGIVLELPGSSVPPLSMGTVDDDSVLPTADKREAEPDSSVHS
jgi:hypothetical protein